MIGLDLLGTLVPVIVMVGLVGVTYLERLALSMEEAIGFGVLGGVALKLAIGRIQMRIGTYVRCGRKRS
mgnify:CR=1 FL=1